MPAPAPGGPSRILIIKHGALGDFVMALGPAQAIRAHHADAHITLLTTAPYAELARASGLFDEVWIDSRPRVPQLSALLALRRRLRQGGFERVYDLQTSSRSSFYFHLFPAARRPEWSGIVQRGSHPHDNPARRGMHTIDRQADQLHMAGIGTVPAPSLDWVAADVSDFGLKAPYALLVPGGAAHRPRKRWPASRYAELAGRLSAQGLIPVVIGGPDERAIAAEIAAACPAVVNLAGKTGLGQIAVLARGAALAVGNDTGPMHMTAIAGCDCVVLFSNESDPDRTAPRGRSVKVLRREPLSSLPVDEVWRALGLT